MTTLDLARRFLGIKETQPGGASTPLVLAMLDGVNPSIHDTQTAWCSAFVNFVAWLGGWPESHSLAARSWLKVGALIDPGKAQPGDVVVLKRGPDPQPGPDVINAQGHVGFVDHVDGTFVYVLAGNQNNQIDVAAFPIARVLGVRRLTA